MQIDGVPTGTFPLKKETLQLSIMLDEEMTGIEKETSISVPEYTLQLSDTDSKKKGSAGDGTQKVSKVMTFKYQTAPEQITIPDSFYMDDNSGSNVNTPTRRRGDGGDSPLATARSASAESQQLLLQNKN